MASSKSTFSGSGFQHSGSGAVSIGGDFNIHSLCSFQVDPPAMGHGARSANDDGNKSRNRQTLYEVLEFDEIDSRLSNLGLKHGKSCRWFLDQDDYNAWRKKERIKQHHGIIWIKGKPGAGKSFLMKYLFEEAVDEAKKNPNALVISFFFHARGVELEKDPIGLYRSLLWQLLGKARDLQLLLENPTDKRFVEKNGWNLAILQKLLQKAVLGLGDRELQIYVDALDECKDSEVEGMVKFFSDLRDDVADSKNPFSLRICMSSRPYPTINVVRAAEIVLEGQPGHGQDIEQYIKSNLNAIYEKEDPKRFKGLKSAVLKKSRGIFLWVAVVIAILNDEIVKGRSRDLEICLHQIPYELEELFSMVLRRSQHQKVSSQRQKDEWHLQKELFERSTLWLLYAIRPLELKEYYCAVNFPASELADFCELDEKNDGSMWKMCQFVTYSSLGFAEVIKTGRRWAVQFIHETVRDFLRTYSEYGSEELLEANSHKVIRDRCLSEILCCTKNIEFMEFLGEHNWPLPRTVEIVSHPGASGERYLNIYQREPKANLKILVCRRLPFLQYAISYILQHARFIESEEENEAFMDSLPFKYWVYFHNIFQDHESLCYTLDESLRALARNDLPNLVRIALKRTQISQFQPRVHYSASMDACTANYLDTFKMLMMQDESLRAISELSQLKYLYGCPCRGRKLLDIAIQLRREAIAKVLLDSGEVDVDKYNQTPLSCGLGYLTVSSLFYLRHNNKFPRPFRDLIMLLAPSWFIQTGDPHGAQKIPIPPVWSNFVNLITDDLADRHVSIRTLSDDERTARSPYGAGEVAVLPYPHLAAISGNVVLMRLLLETGKVNLHMKDLILGRTALSYAAENGHTNIVETLLRAGNLGFVDMQDTEGRTALHYAAENGHTNIVETLLRAGNLGFVDMQDTEGRTALHYAAENGHTSIVEMLLRAGNLGFVDMQDTEGRTALHYATENGYANIVDMMRAANSASPTFTSETDDQDNDDWGISKAFLAK